MNNPFNKLNLKSILIISVLVITIIVFRFYVNRGLETSIGMGGFILISLTLFYLSYSSNLISKSQRNKWLFTITFTLILLISCFKWAAVIVSKSDPILGMTPTNPQ